MCVCVLLEYSLEDSDLEGLSDITVSSVHTSDLSSFEGDSDGDEPLSESTEEGELSSEGEKCITWSATVCVTAALQHECVCV